MIGQMVTVPRKLFLANAYHNELEALFKALPEERLAAKPVHVELARSAARAADRADLPLEERLACAYQVDDYLAVVAGRPITGCAKSDHDVVIEAWRYLKNFAPGCETVRKYRRAELFWETVQAEDRQAEFTELLAAREGNDMHVCEGPESRTARMLLALHSRDDDALQLVRNEIDGCARCWQSIAGWLANLLAGVREMDAGSPAAAADSVAAELARLLHG